MSSIWRPIAATGRSVLSVLRDAGFDVTARRDGIRAASLPYIYALAELAQAESSEAMVATMERIAAPVGSYRLKAKRELFTITALFGYAQGKESYPGEQEALRDYGSLFAPLGVQYTFPFCAGDLGALGVLGSLVDLGPLVASRKTGSDVQEESRVGLRQVFSPGFYLTWNPLRSRPLVIGYGVRRTPQLVQTNAGSDVSSTRWIAFIAMDLTLFGF